MKDPRSWLIWLAAAAMIGAIAIGRGSGPVKAGPNLACLTHVDCAKGLRCYAMPKDDPFATFGVCVEPCLDDLQCPSGMKCAVTAKGNAQVVPVKVGLEPGERVCIR